MKVGQPILGKINNALYQVRWIRADYINDNLRYHQNIRIEGVIDEACLYYEFKFRYTI